MTCTCGRAVVLIDDGPVHADGRDDHPVQLRGAMVEYIDPRA
jgi:hypothetical protein